MKTLIDGTQVYDNTFYYLLTWNEKNNWKYIEENFKKSKLKDLTISEYLELFEYATKQEIEKLKENIL